MSTIPKKKKKKVVKRVIKKKKVIKKQQISNGYSPKHTYGHTKISPFPTTTQQHRTRTPSIQDAITRFTQIIEDQTKFIEKLKQENQKLKNEVEELKNRPPEKIYIRKSITNNDIQRIKTPPPPRALPHFSTATATKSNPNPITITPHRNTNSGVVTNITQHDAKNALAGLFGAAKARSQPTATATATDQGGVVTNITQKDAKNALAGLFAAKRPGLSKAKSAMILPPAKKDDDQGINLDITTPFRLMKYVKLGKIMPVHVVENRMKMDGITKILIGQLTKQWMKAAVPPNVDLVDRETAAPPPMAKEFSDLIDSKENEFNDDDSYDKILALGLKPKRKIIPSRKMKRFHWKKIEVEHIPPTLWKDIDDVLVVFNKIEFELKFQFRTPRPTQRKNLSKKDRSGQIYTFVLPKRSQNIQIALSRFKMSDDALKAAVIAMDESVFSINALESFIEMAPTEEEQRETESHAHKEDVDVAYFGRCEKFFYSFIDIVDLSLRLELWLFMQNFKEIVSDKQAQIYKLQSGIRALSDSVSFKNVLQLLLAWGNHMNGGSHAGQAYGFEVDSLALLPGIKTMDTSMNLMMYLYKTLYEKFPQYLDVIIDLKSIKVCATMETEMLDKSVTQIKEKFDSLQATVTRFEEDYLDVLPMEDKFIEYGTKWITKNRKHLTKLIMMHRRTKNKCRQLSVLFHWDLEQKRIETLFAICNTFISDLYKARDDIHKLEIEREKRRRKQKRKKKQQNRQNAKEQHQLQRKRVAKEQHTAQKKKFALRSGQKHKRSIMDDVMNRKRKNTAILKKLGGKLERSLVEKSKLIEATNYKQKLPEVFKKNKVKRKMSSVYNERVKGSKAVPKGRMRLPTIVSRKGLPALPALKQGNEAAHSKYKNKINVKVGKGSRLKRKRKRTKGWFEKGKEPKVGPWSAFAPPQMSYNPLSQYDYKSAHKRRRGISNNGDVDDMKGAGNRWRSDTPSDPKSGTALTQISREDLNKGQAVARKWSDAQHPSLKKKNKFGFGRENQSNNIPIHKRAQSMKMHSRQNRLHRAAYSPPNMGIVRLNKLGITDYNKSKAKKKSGADLNIPKHLADGGDDFLLLESPAASPEPRRMSGQYKFTEENNWD